MKINSVFHGSRDRTVGSPSRVDAITQLPTILRKVTSAIGLGEGSHLLLSTVHFLIVLVEV